MQREALLEAALIALTTAADHAAYGKALEQSRAALASAPAASAFDPAVPTNDRCRAIARQARDRNGPSDTTDPVEYVLEGWREAEKHHGIHPWAASASHPQAQVVESTALLPCPFCGGAAHFEADDDRWEWIECGSCGMRGDRSASLGEDCKPHLRKAWNRRAAPGAQDLERLLFRIGTQYENLGVPADAATTPPIGETKS